MRLCKHGVPFTDKHDCKYVDERDTLIPAAERYANRHAGPKPVGTRDDNPELLAWVNRWNFLFHSRMDALWKLQRQERAA